MVHHGSPEQISELIRHHMTEDLLSGVHWTHIENCLLEYYRKQFSGIEEEVNKSLRPMNDYKIALTNNLPTKARIYAFYHQRSAICSRLMNVMCNYYGIKYQISNYSPEEDFKRSCENRLKQLDFFNIQATIERVGYSNLSASAKRQLTTLVNAMLSARSQKDRECLLETALNARTKKQASLHA